MSTKELIYYSWNNIPCIRTRPQSRRQTAASIEKANLFKQAKLYSKIIRDALVPVLPHTNKRWLMLQVDRAFLKLYYHAGFQPMIPAFEHLNLVKEMEFPAHVAQQVQVSNHPEGIVIHVLDKKIIDEARLRCMVLSGNIHNEAYDSVSLDDMRIDMDMFNDHCNEELTIDIKPGYFFMVVIGTEIPTTLHGSKRAMVLRAGFVN